MPKQLTLDLQQLEDLAAEGKTQTELAKALGFKFSTFTLRLKVNKETREAYERGRQRAEESGISQKPIREQTTEAAAADQPIVEVPVKDDPAQAESVETETLDERSLVKKAVRAGHNLVSSIAKSTNLTRLEINEVLPEMFADDEVEWRDVGTVRAWFIKDEVPAGRLYLNGYGGVLGDTNPEPKLRHVTASSLAKVTASSNGSNGHKNPSSPQILPPEVLPPAQNTNRLALLKKVQTELMFYDAYGEFSPKCDELLKELTEVLK
ncbi:MAG: hypothetical protein M3209_09675 [Acidobacteriota bacterium]|nr:hypothetical protein [Acidobacteriota bacterium]